MKMKRLAEEQIIGVLREHEAGVKAADHSAIVGQWRGLYVTARVPISNPVRNEWLALRNEPVLDPGRPIVDAHHHLWDRPGWRYLFLEFLEDVGSGHNVVSSVFVQARSMYRAEGPPELRPVGEVEFVNGIAAMSASGLYGGARLCAGIVGHADLTLGYHVEPVLNALVRAGGDRLRGVRHITAWDPDGSLLNPAYPTTSSLMNERPFREGFAALGRMSLSFDAWLYHPQIDDLRKLADDFPDVVIVLNHAGGPIGIGTYRSQQKDVFASWANSIRELAKRPNVYVKIGGLEQAIRSRPSRWCNFSSGLRS